MRLRVGIVGLGDAWETRHRPALRALSDRFEVKAICSEVAMRAERAAREFDAVAIDGFRALTLREDIDAVFILAPDWVGSLPVLAACQAGKAIYSTAALHVIPDEARRIKQSVESSGVAFMAELPRRHAPATLRLKELIATRLGQPKLLFCHDRVRLHQRNGRPHASENSTPVRDLMEIVDWCRYVTSREPVTVVGASHNSAGKASENYQMMSLAFEADETGGGPLAQISCGDYFPQQWHEAISFRTPAAMQVRCEHGVAFVDLPATLIWFDEAGQHLESLHTERPVGEQLLTHFHRAVTSLVRKTSDLEDAYRALKTVLAARESCETGRRVTLDF